MVLGEPNHQDGGLVDEVGVELGPAERGGGSVQSGVSKVELGERMSVLTSRPVTSAEIER
jgi:hypothetical protein